MHCFSEFRAYIFTRLNLSPCVAPCHSGFINAHSPGLRPVPSQGGVESSTGGESELDLQTSADLLDKPETEERPLKSAPSALWLGWNPSHHLLPAYHPPLRPRLSTHALLTRTHTQRWYCQPPKCQTTLHLPGVPLPEEVRGIQMCCANAHVCLHTARRVLHSHHSPPRTNLNHVSFHPIIN